MKPINLSAFLGIWIFLSFTSIPASIAQVEQTPALPPTYELNRSFGSHDEIAFEMPSKVYYPETWFHYIGGNVSLSGITTDLEAIAHAGISGIQLFHGQFGGPWPGVEPQITCLSPLWDDAVKHTAEECRRLGLRFTMQNCPGWAMSGGPWIEPSNAMRHLAWSRTDVDGYTGASPLQLPKPQPSEEPWRDYKEIAVLAFPTPEGDTGTPLQPASIRSSIELSWKDCLAGTLKEPLRLPATTADNPYWIEVSFRKPVPLRTVELPSINSMSHGWSYEPGVTVTVEALTPENEKIQVLHTDLPAASWQDDYPISLACQEVAKVSKYRISIVNQHDMSVKSLRLFSAARQNNWESEAGWTLRAIERKGEGISQSSSAYIDWERVIDISDKMDKNGQLSWNAPAGKWTVLRIGHINTGMRNSPAPPEGTGWECDKLSMAGPEAHFAGYIGRLSGADGALAGGLLNGMLLDSWECKTQTWTPGLEEIFLQETNYPLRKWLPAVFGYVVNDPETTKKFLRDWRGTIGNLFANRFYGRMAELAKENSLSITYETAAGDIFPADILEYYKHADIPMCEFWHPIADNYVGSINFKPIKPTTSAARIYGKPRVAAEAFTSFSLTWDEHLEMLKEVANMNSIEGVTHLVFHTYTHNPQTPFLPPGTSMGSGIGTPFLRGQTWWKFMPLFTDYLARCSYLLERGKPVSDVLWYLGDEINHKPDQNAPFPEGFKYDYCNPDVLLNRLSVQNGAIVTPEGISYRVLWLPDTPRMLPQTLEKIYELLCEGATIVGNAPKGLATLIGGEAAKERFDQAVSNIWGENLQYRGIRNIGKGSVISGMSLKEALTESNMTPDVTGSNALWLHRQTKGADWYFVTAPKGSDFSGILDFRCTGQAEIWDPVTGKIQKIDSEHKGDRTLVKVDLPKAGACFIVFKQTDDINNTSVHSTQQEVASSILLSNPWTLHFPDGWDAPPTLQVSELKPWKDLDLSSEGKAFSGTVTYTTTFDIKKVEKEKKYMLDLGEVDMVAEVSVNGKRLRTLWASPYQLELTDLVNPGENTLTIEVTSTWFNRLVYDAGQPEDTRKTWTINGPDKNVPLRSSGLLGPVKLLIQNK